MGRERTVEQSWAEWEGDLERNRAITSGQYINTHHLKVQLRAVYVCVCLSCYSGAQLTGTTCQRIGPLLSPSGSGAQWEWLPGGTEEWVKCHHLELAAALALAARTEVPPTRSLPGEGTGQPLPFTKDGQP